MFSLLASTYLLLLLRFNPRIFLRHYPKEIEDIIPPKSEKEQRMSIFLGLHIGTPITSALLWRTATLAMALGVKPMPSGETDRGLAQ